MSDQLQALQDAISALQTQDSTLTANVAELLSRPTTPAIDLSTPIANVNAVTQSLSDTNASLQASLNPPSPPITP